MDETASAAPCDRQSDFSSLACDYAKFRTSYSEELFDAILTYSRTPPGGRVLDVACGTGLGMLSYLRRGFQVVGVDVSGPMMQQAQAALPPGSRAEFVEGNAEALPFADSSFDLISCAQAFHWFEPRAAFTECARVLRPGGTLAIFWKHAARTDALTQSCEQLIREWMGEAAAVRSRDHADEHEAGWPVFWEFVTPLGEAADARPLIDGQKRIVEFELQRNAEEFVGYQRSREKIRKVLGERRPEFLIELERRLHSIAPGGIRLTQRQIQYVFLARHKADQA